MGIIEYQSNNSGGNWWLEDKDWIALENAGWVVHWIHDPFDPSHDHRWAKGEPREWQIYSHFHGYLGEFCLIKVTLSGSRWLGALAKSAAKETNDPELAVIEWSRITGQNPDAEGCNCCGQPHDFSYKDGGKIVYRETQRYVSYGSGAWI